MQPRFEFFEFFVLSTNFRKLFVYLVMNGNRVENNTKLRAAGICVHIVFTI